MKNFILTCAVALSLAAVNGLTSRAVKDYYFHRATGGMYATPIEHQPNQNGATYRTDPCTKLPCAHSSYKIGKPSLPKAEVARALPIVGTIARRNTLAQQAGE